MSREEKVIYLDENRNEVSEEEAKYAMIEVYENGVLVSETVGVIER